MNSFILLGDFNVNFQNAHHLLFSYINDILLTISLKQVVYLLLISAPTQQTLLLISLCYQIHFIFIIVQLYPPLATSDHLGVSLVINWTSPKPIKNPSRLVWIYNETLFGLTTCHGRLGLGYCYVRPSLSCWFGTVSACTQALCSKLQSSTKIMKISCLRL